MTRRVSRQEKCAVFEYDRIDIWGPELKRHFKEILPKNLKRIFAAEPPDDVEHAREILLAHAQASREVVIEMLKDWLMERKIAAYYDVGLPSDAEMGADHPSLSRAAVEESCIGEEGTRVAGMHMTGAKALEAAARWYVPGCDIPNLVRDVLDAWAYWLADRDYSPAHDCLFIGFRFKLDK